MDRSSRVPRIWLFSLSVALLITATLFARNKAQARPAISPQNLRGEAALRFLQENDLYPLVAAELSPQGRPFVQTDKLAADDGLADDRFGYAVAVSADTAFVGARMKDVGYHTDQGVAYVFVRDDTGWTQQGKLTASDGTSSDNFGLSVAIDGDIVVVGAPNGDYGE